MKVSIDQVSCVGSGQCVFPAPEVFDQRDEDGIVMLLQNAPDEGLYLDTDRIVGAVAWNRPRAAPVLHHRVAEAMQRT